MAGTTVRRAISELGYPGPHQVLRGELAPAGLPGVVFTPAGGRALPAVAFGHGWLQPTARYPRLLWHLASWGIVAAAPDSQRGPLASHAAFAADLRATLDVCTRVRLGSGDVGGEISVDPARLAVAGHGMGGGCAVLAAAADARVAAVVTLAVAETRPSAIKAARRVRVPGLHLAAGRDKVAPPAGNAEPIAAAWDGPAWLRTLPKADHLSFTEGRHWTDLLIDGSPDPGAHRLTRALVTGFLLRYLAGETDDDELVEGPLKGTEVCALA